MTGNPFDKDFDCLGTSVASDCQILDLQVANVMCFLAPIGGLDAG